MFKIGSAVQEASICLRCQYRLSLQGRQQSKIQRKLWAARQYTVGGPIGQEQPQLNGADTIDAALSKPIIRYEPYESTPRPRHSGKRLNVIPIKDSLGFDSLGQPAEVLILQKRSDQDKYGSDHAADLSSEEREEKAADATSSRQLLDELDAERGIIEIEQVCDNIEAVKTEWVRDTKLPWEAARQVVATKKYKSVAKRLHDGFTVNQLAAYLRINTEKQQADPLNLRRDFTGSLYARSSWSPGITDLWRIKAPEISEIGAKKAQSGVNLRGGSDRQGLRKGVLVDKIMQHCWHIRPKDDESLLGEMDIRLQAVHLELIVNHKRGILKQISDTYGAKVEASKRDQIIRVTSDYETSLDILKLIIQTLGNVEFSVVDLPAESRLDSQSTRSQNEAQATILREVMSSTNTIIQEIKSTLSDRELRIYYVGPDDEDAEDARRLIGQSLKSAPAKERKVLLGRSIKRSRDLLVPIDVGNGLSLIDRSQQWSRWSSRSIRAIDPTRKKEGSAVRINTMENPLDQRDISQALNDFFVVPNHDHDIATETKPHWVSRVTYWDSTLLGQILLHTSDIKPGGFQPKIKDSRRGFLTMVPGLLRSLETMGMENLNIKGWSEEFLLIRLIPAFKNNLPVPFEVLPDLEIRIQFDENEKTTRIRDVRLVRRNELDLLLPQNTMDLRFVRQICVYSRYGGLDQCIKQFVDDSNLAIWGTGRLKTPTTLKLSIPPHSLGPIRDGRTAEGFEHEEVEYSFASLEHRSEIGVPIHQQGSRADLTYTSIEAGRIGGRRDELVLKQPRGPKRKTHNTEEIDDDEQQVDVDANINDDAHSASLLRKANELINTIENPKDDGMVREAYGVGGAQRELNREKRRDKMKEGGDRRGKGIRMIPGNYIRKLGS